MKKDNNSVWFKDWTTKKLKDEAMEFHDIIYGQNAYNGNSDIQLAKRYLDGVLAELDNRGIEIIKKISFN